MALRTTPAPVAALRGSVTPTEDVWEVEELRMEASALRAERDAIRVELVRLRDLLTYAFGIDGWHIALSVRDRLASLSACLERRSA